MSKIYHITTRAVWLQAQSVGEYRDASLGEFGFIHFSQKEQVAGTISRFYAGRTDLILLEVDEASLGNTVKYEWTPVGQQFPHLYGALPIAAVEQIFTLVQDAGGEVAWVHDCVLEVKE